MTSRLSDSTSECETIMEAQEYEDTEYTSESNTEVDQIAISSARRTTQLIARKSLIWARDYLEKLPIKLTLGNLGFFAVVLAIIMPRAFTYILVYPIFRLVFGTLYPAYASYKAVRTKNVKEYVKWMMYWIVFALFTCAETFTDVFFSFWFPFYYEIKIILVLWLLSPATKGSSILYRRFVHPALSRREAEIDDALARATEQGYTAVLHLGTRGVNYATTVLMQTAIKNFPNVVPTKTPSSPLPASQSDTAISSLANPRSEASDAATTTTRHETWTVDGTTSIATPVRNSSKRRAKGRDRETRSVSPFSPLDEQPSSYDEDEDVDFMLDMVEEEDDDDDNIDDVDYIPDNEISRMIHEEESPVEFKVPTEKPKKRQKREIGRMKGRKTTLRSYDPEFSDEPDSHS